MTRPTNEAGKPTASTPALMAGDSTFASPTTATRATTSRTRLAPAARVVGGSACSSGPAGPCGTGRKKLRWRTVCVATNEPYRTNDATAANVSCAGENSGPGSLVVKVGRTSVNVASVATVASAAPVPSALKTATCWRRDEERQPEAAVAGDHHGGEDGVPRQRRCLRAARDDEREDQDDLDDRHGHTQHERAERLPDAMRHNLGDSSPSPRKAGLSGRSSIASPALSGRGAPPGALCLLLSAEHRPGGTASFRWSHPPRCALWGLRWLCG